MTSEVPDTARDPHAVLQGFDANVAGWFKDNFASPTAVQQQAWPVIARGEHGLLTAPTGSGKTLTAFLWSLNQFATGALATGATRVLYISPLKALNNDIQRNLLTPLAQLRERMDFPALRVATRSGDTTASERQKLLRKPPEILITTPESFALMLSTLKGQLALSTVSTLILDEIHAVVDNRRGVQLMTSMERLALIAGEFQRLALSATVNPLEPIARYVGGRTQEGVARPVTIINASSPKTIELKVRYPAHVKEAVANGQKIWEPLAISFKEQVQSNQSTLFFTNSRRLAEKITLKINQDEPTTLAYAHHGSLAREIRAEVEQQLKAGELKAIVATNSLEMGIDIGSLDEVVMVQAPLSIASALQRIGRAGHQVGATSHSTLYPTHANDFLESAVLADCVERRDIEPIVPMVGALDVLAQVLVSMTAFQAWSVDDLFRTITCSGPYLKLPREQFDSVLEMLAGRYSGSRVRELKPRVAFDRIKNEVSANRGAVLAMYNSGGTIPDRGYYKLRHVDSGAQIGELDEEFVWEATTGDTFTLGTQAWQVQRITHNDVLVRAAPSKNKATPFWRSEAFHRNWYFSDQIAQYLELNEARLADKKPQELEEELVEERGFDTGAAVELVDYLTRQRVATNSALPHRHHLLVEEVLTGPGGYRGPADVRQTVLHTFWGGSINQPWALALNAVWRKLFDTKPEIHADNNAIVLQHNGPIDINQLLWAVNPENLIGLLRETLEGSGYFGARFRECAGRALLLTKNRFNQRLPLWMNRLQAKKLMATITQYNDFPILLETWRTCLNDEFDLPALSLLLNELHNGEITWQQVTTNTPSPFAADLTFNHINEYMYADDTPESSAASQLDADAITLALTGVTSLPQVSANVVGEFLAKRQRTAPGYEPRTALDWQEWVKERVLIPTQELVGLQVEEQEGFDAARDIGNILELQQDQRSWYCHLELAQVVQDALAPSARFRASKNVESILDSLPNLDDQRSAEQLALEILSFYGPLNEQELTQLLPQVPPDLAQHEDLLNGQLLLEVNDNQICDAQNFEVLLRFQRASRRSHMETQPQEAWPAFVAAWQGVGVATYSDTTADDALFDRLEQLRGFSAPVGIWLQDIMAARFTNFPEAKLDQATNDIGMSWLGTGRETICLLYPEDVPIVQGPATPNPLTAYFNDPAARYSYAQIVEAASATRWDMNDQWWASVWAGQLGADSLAPLRQGLQRKFQASDVSRTSRRRRLSANQGWSGNWYLQPDQAPATDAVAELERAKDAARILLDRYGVLTREMANREGGELRWAKVFKALRVMELAGEISAGYFFAGMSGPQFITPQALALLRRNEPDKQHFWLNSQDPAAPCGLGLTWPELPARRGGNFMSFVEGKLALVIENHGKRLQFFLDADDAQQTIALYPLERLLRLRKRLPLESINNQPVGESAYFELLDRNFRMLRDHKQYTLELSL